MSERVRRWRAPVRGSARPRCSHTRGGPWAGRSGRRGVATLRREATLRASRRPRAAFMGLVLLLTVAGCTRTSEGEGVSEAASRELAAIVATCAAAHGPVDTMRTTSAYWEPFEAGATFRAGDWVRTGPGAFVRIELRGAAASSWRSSPWWWWSALRWRKGAVRW